MTGTWSVQAGRVHALSGELLTHSQGLATVADMAKADESIADEVRALREAFGGLAAADTPAANTPAAAKKRHYPLRKKRYSSVMRLRFGGACAALVLLVGGLFVSGSAAATATEAEDGLWYIDALHVRDAWNAGFTGEGVTIAVIDSPINPSIPALAGADVRVHEPLFCLDQASGDFFPATSTELTGPTNAVHGTNVTAMIVGNGQGYDGNPGPMGVAPRATVLYYAATMKPTVQSDDSIECLDRDPQNFLDDTVSRAIDSAVDDGADIISVSLGIGFGEALSASIVRAYREGVVIVAALPNPSGELFGSAGYPAFANGVVAVNGIDPEAKLLAAGGFENALPWVTVAAPGKSILNQGYGGDWSAPGLAEGTSYAAPIVAGFLAVVLQKYPDATGNQLIQTLIHNTGGSGHKLTRGPVGFGYGVASLTSMLEVDPTQYEDVNPLLTEDDLPSLEEINGSASPVPDDAPDDSGAVPDDAPDDSGAVPVAAVWSGLGFVVLFVVIGMGVLLAVGVVVILVVIRRSRRAQAETK